ncbi:AAA family ATPase [Curtobacterium flaccumfaciens]|uniref:AAA family ATPase n=1 Tax=Curtobacterium flaccumfaciens TaxID=2035 RepID=UPI003F819E5A
MAPSPERSSVGELVRRARLAAGLTLEDLATRADVSARALSDVERGVSTTPRRRTIEAVVEALALPDEARDEVFAAARPPEGTVVPDTRFLTTPPPSLGDFTGRDAELRTIEEHLAAVGPGASVLVHGAPGMGKTSTALEVFRRAHHQAVFVDLDGLAARPLTPLQVLQALVAQVGGAAAPRTFAAAAAAWQRLATEHRPVVLLDNAASDDQVSAVLVPEGATVLVTSRRALPLHPGMRKVTLEPLGGQDGVRLLERIVPLGQRSRGDVDELAQLCARNPLALRVAGNRLLARPTWDVEDMVARLRDEDHRLRGLVAGDLAVAAAFALSYDGLDAATAEVFRAASVITSDDFDARAAAAAADVAVLDAQDALDELVHLGLVERRRDERHRLHDLIRIFALERLRQGAADAEAQATDRLRSWLLMMLERAGAWFEPDRDGSEAGDDGIGLPDAETARGWIEREWRHWWWAFQTAAGAGHHATVVDVADSLHWFSDRWSDWGRWRDLFALSVTAARALGDARLEGVHLGYLAWAELIERADEAAAVRAARASGRAARAAGDRSVQGWALIYEAWARSNGGDHEAARVRASESVAVFSAADDVDGRRQATVLLAVVVGRLGDTAVAAAAFDAIERDAYERLAADPDDQVARFDAVSSMSFRTEFLLSQRQWAAAVAAADRAREEAARLGWHVGEALALRDRGDALAAIGDAPGALAAFQGAMDSLRSSPGAGRPDVLDSLTERLAATDESDDGRRGAAP